MMTPDEVRAAIESGEAVEAKTISGTWRSAKALRLVKDRAESDLVWVETTWSDGCVTEGVRLLHELRKVPDG